MFLNIIMQNFQKKKSIEIHEQYAACTHRIQNKINETKYIIRNKKKSTKKFCNKTQCPGI